MTLPQIAIEAIKGYIPKLKNKVSGIEAEIVSAREAVEQGERAIKKANAQMSSAQANLQNLINMKAQITTDIDTLKSEIGEGRDGITRGR